jgi:hypothetical protein
MGLIIIAFIFNFFSTWYFGWNMHPMSPNEHACDHLAMMLFAAGIAEVIARKIAKIHEDKYHGNDDAEQE